jgi:nitroimidazol reductase NimA-like FMN-containing flavoprotein (pyridoxamine 5'-phosphate oxidase superfamily)
MAEEKIFTDAQLKFLKSHTLCRFAVAELNGMPHVTPVVYAMDHNNPIIAVDYGSKKLRVLRENSKVSLVVDDVNPHGGLVIQGECEIYERGSVYMKLLDVLMKEFEIYRENPWKEGESPILKVIPQKAASWGI